MSKFILKYAKGFTFGIYYITNCVMDKPKDICNFKVKKK